MEHVLLQIARKLDELDEASLMSLWNKYAVIVSHFEPSKRWEEAVLIFGIIQAKRWKNQLFNQQYIDTLKPDKPKVDIRIPVFAVDKKRMLEEMKATKDKKSQMPETRHHAEILQFKKKISE